MSLQRIPLQEYSNNYSQLTETPSKSYLQNSVTTPPETTNHIRKKRLSIETPITKNSDHQNYHNPNMLSNSLLLSPAFLSPQQYTKPYPSNSVQYQHQHLQEQQQLQQQQQQFHHMQQQQHQQLQLQLQQQHQHLHFNQQNQHFSNASTNQYIQPPSIQQPQQLHYNPLDIAPPPPKPSFNDGSIMTNSFDGSSATAAPTGASGKKKSKKSKKDAKDYPFDLDSEDKPPYSYATLIGMSILSNPDKKLTLSQIYQWISDTFKYYKREEVGWQNSIRHNLSLNKAFLKGQKSKDGKGHFWCIQDGCEDQFLKSRSSKKQLYQEIMEHIYNKPATNANSNTSFASKSSMNSLPSSPNISHNSITEEDLNPRKRGIEGAADYEGDEEQEEDEEGESDITRDDNADELSNDGSAPSSSKRIKLSNEHLNPLGAPFSQYSTQNNIGTSSISISDNTAASSSSVSTNSNASNLSKDTMDTPLFMLTESPNKPLLAGKNLTYTSSFSCNSNLELSPIRPSETGPLLEPLTPVHNVYKSIPISNEASINQLNANLHFHCHTKTPNRGSISSQVPSQSPFTARTTSHLQPPLSHHPHSLSHPILPQPQTLAYITKTPKNNMSKTPLRSLRSPQTSSILKKLCYSPSYIDEFYYSPLVSASHTALNSYDDDDLISRTFESPAAKRLQTSSARKLFGDFKKAEVITKEITEESKDSERVTTNEE